MRHYLDYGETFSFWYHLKLPNVAEFPNPTHRELNLTLPETTVEVRIFDATGRAVYIGKAAKQIQIDVQNWQAGLHFVEVRDAGAGLAHRLKVVIQP
jgi:Secretion system C-terminal sorting domain